MSLGWLWVVGFRQMDCSTGTRGGQWVGACLSAQFAAQAVRSMREVGIRPDGALPELGELCQDVRQEGKNVSAICPFARCQVLAGEQRFAFHLPRA
jgi:hypothetical protein